MAYEPQPGTIPYRAIACLKEKRKTGLLWEPSTAELCEVIDTGVTGFSTCMAPAVTAGLVKSRMEFGLKGRWLVWSLSDDKPPPAEPETILPPRQMFNAQPATALPPPPPRSRTVGLRVRPLVHAHQPGCEAIETMVAPEQAAQTQLGAAPAKAPAAEPEAAPASPKKFDAWLSGVTGKLMLKGVRVDSEGDVTLPRDQVAVIRKLLEVNQ